MEKPTRVDMGPVEATYINDPNDPSKRVRVEAVGDEAEAWLASLEPDNPKEN